MFCIYLRTNSDLCHLQHKLIGFYNRDENSAVRTGSLNKAVCASSLNCYLRTNSDLCHLQHKLMGFYNPDVKCLQRGTDWVFKQSGLRFVSIGLKSDKNNGYFVWRPKHIFDHTLLNYSQNHKCFRQKLYRKSKHAVFVQILFFRKTYRIWDNLENIVQPCRLQMTIRRMRIACSIPEATNTPPEYVTLIVFPLQQWLQDYVSVLRYTYTTRLICNCPNWGVCPSFH